MSFFYGKHKPFIIAGPCSAESREQVLETAAALAAMPVQLFRAGVWKPRTRPGSFEGMGEPALKWLQEAKSSYNICTAIEVAETNHVELALKYGIDVLWIGARTTVNPFQVQRLADALQGLNIPVMVKNPVNPDVDLWLGAIERLERAGMNDIAAIHRGFSGYNTNGSYRNEPNWTIPIELKRRRPALPLFCDPSHITGKRERIAEVSQKAMDLDFDGLMIETHPNPDAALSDAAQQITPDTLNYVLNHLVIRTAYNESRRKDLEIEHLRQLMDSLDAEIIDLLARRMDLSKKMGDWKKKANMTVFQPDRWREIVDSRAERAMQHNLSKPFILALYELIHHESIQNQLAVLKDEASENVNHKPQTL